MSPDRSWIKNRVGPGGYGITDEYRMGVKGFIELCQQYPGYLDRGNIRCPCCDCRSLKFIPPDMVSFHLISRGFERGYINWVRQGEPRWDEPSSQAPTTRKCNDLQENNRKSQLSNQDGLGVVKSTKTTIPIPHHAHRMARKNGGSRTHRTNKGQEPLVGDESKKTSVETYPVKLEEIQSQSNGTTILPSTQGSCTYYPEVCTEASRGPKSGHCYGFGNSHSDSFTFSGPSSSNSSSRAELDQIKEQIQELEKKQRELEDSFDQRVTNILYAALAMHGIFPGQQFCPGQHPSQGQYHSLSQYRPPAPPYFPPPALGQYHLTSNFQAPGQHSPVHYQSPPGQHHSPGLHHSSGQHHSPDQLVTKS